MSLSAIPHSPLGANASLDFGPAGAPAGFAVPAGTGGGEGLYIGCRPDPRSPWSLLPFFPARPDGVQPLAKGRFGRFFAAGGDKWMIGPLVFKVCTPFELEPSTDERFRYAPVLCGYLEYENTHNDEPVELAFGVGETGEALATAGMLGFRVSRGAGFATMVSPEAALEPDLSFLGAAPGPGAALHFRVPAGARRLYPLVIGFDPAGTHAANDFAGLADVLQFGLQQHARYLALADQRDAEFMRSALDPADRIVVAESVRRWLAQSSRPAGASEVDLAPLRALWARVAG